PLFGSDSIDAAKTPASKFARRHAGLRLEGAVERSKRLEARVQRNGQDRDCILSRVRQRRHYLVEAIAIQKRVEVAVAKTTVDQMPQTVLGDAELAGEPTNRKPVL